MVIIKVEEIAYLVIILGHNVLINFHLGSRDTLEEECQNWQVLMNEMVINAYLVIVLEVNALVGLVAGGTGGLRKQIVNDKFP